MSFAHHLAQIPALRSFAFGPGGCQVARLARRDGSLVVEARSIGTGTELVHAEDPLLAFGTELCVPSADRIWIRSGRPGGFRLLEARRTGPGAGWRTEPIVESAADGLRFLACLEGSGSDLVVSTEDGESTIWRIEGDPPGMRPLIKLPGVVGTGAWLEPGRSLAVNISQPGCPPSGFLVDLAAQTCDRWFHVSERSADTIAGCDLQSGVLWVATDYPGHRKAGVADLRGARRVRFVEDPPGEERSVNPVGRWGQHLILARQRGVATELWLAEPTALTVAGPLRLAAGSVASSVVDAGDRFRFAFSGPTVPMACAAYLPIQDAFQLEEPPDVGDLDPAGLVTPRIVQISGPHGAIETLVYEPPAGRLRPTIVVALHGGPAAQWTAAFTPELQLFAGLGAVVAAPNYHGSTGYGDEFVRALERAGGSIDLDDVLAVIAAMRGEPGYEGAAVVLYGHSYGAFLALLVAATHPHLCDAVIAVAPFTSLSSVGSASTPAIRRITNLLRDPARIEGDPDLLGRCRNLRARVLIAHGTEDRIIPIAQSHALCERLRACGFRDGHDLWFLPLRGEDHAIVTPGGASRLYEQIELFLSEVPAVTRRPGSARAPGASFDEGQGFNEEQGFDEEQDVAGRLPHSRAPGPWPLCDAISERR